jgi:hypothetical protein
VLGEQFQGDRLDPATCAVSVLSHCLRVLRCLAGRISA